MNIPTIVERLEKLHEDMMNPMLSDRTRRRVACYDLAELINELRGQIAEPTVNPAPVLDYLKEPGKKAADSKPDKGRKLTEAPA